MGNGSERKKIVDYLTTLSIVAASVLLGYLWGKNTNNVASTLNSAKPISRATPKSSAEMVGGTLSLQGEDWAKNGRTLVLALQTGCHFCSESGAFYKKLVQQRYQFGEIRLVAVLPQTTEQSKAYLDKLGVLVDDIRQDSLSSIGVRGTPTLLLVNSSGVVTEAWNGKLKPDSEEAVLARLTTR